MILRRFCVTVMDNWTAMRRFFTLYQAQRLCICPTGQGALSTAQQKQEQSSRTYASLCCSSGGSLKFELVVLRSGPWWRRLAAP